MPVVLFGTNGAIAWGATAGPLDVNDYVELELNPENPHQYRQGDGWADMRLRQETIKVKGAEDVVAEVWERTTALFRFSIRSTTAPSPSTAPGPATRSRR